ncbi:hypothetical protein IWW51_006310 [Coemansia sp. RSA 2702]|nr:hypothetical protein IWW52_006748 [Coemansia sp. RSA 2704]KAJ2312160.1 hypothetical protein IWW51_006310 [Coemansia sp. RSA 2702]KAJ2356011.1 hypothetical protein H4S01_006787 [Coemansia sp. RSA 2610]KAJ2710052.1 hypothetical protein H4R23_006664 [Coemansia sp. Cherry 401B]
MYIRLWRLLLACLVLLFAFFVLNIFYTLSYSRIDIAARTWKWLWFWTDGWVNLEYFVALCVILYWWRPTAENYRYSLEELAGDEAEAAERERADIYDSFDNPRMGENLEMDDLQDSAVKPKSASISGDAVQFVINDEDEDEDEDHDHTDVAAPSSVSPHEHTK